MLTDNTLDTIFLTVVILTGVAIFFTFILWLQNSIYKDIEKGLDKLNEIHNKARAAESIRELNDLSLELSLRARTEYYGNGFGPAKLHHVSGYILGKIAGLNAAKRKPIQS